MRSRAVPCGHGGRTDRRDEQSRALRASRERASASALVPTTSGWIGVSEGERRHRPERNPAFSRATVPEHARAPPFVAFDELEAALQQRAAMSGGVAVV